MKKNSLIKSTVIVMVMAIISRFIGFARDIIIANSFNATYYTDAYRAAQMIPETIFMIVGLAISTTFLPMLSKVREEHGKEEMHRFANNIINILFVISLIIFVVASFFPSQIIELIIGNASEEVKIIATSLTRITLINLMFLSINACFTALLQVHEDFIVPSVLGLFFNLPIILYVLIFKEANIYGLTIANVIGNFLRVIVQIPSLKRHGYRYKGTLNFKDTRIRRILILIIPVVVGASANSLNMLVDTNIVSNFDEGAVTTLNNAQALVTVINTVITTAITTVVYPTLVNKRNTGKNKEFIELLSQTIVYLAILLIPISVGMIIYSGRITSLIFYKYNVEAQGFVTSALIGYSIGIFFVGIRDILNSTLFSMEQTKITAKNGVIGVVINIFLSIILSKIIGIAGVAIASSVAMLVTSVLLLRNICKLEGKLDVIGLLKKIAKVIFATIIMTVAVVLVNIVLKNSNSIIVMIIGTLVGIISYLITIYIIKLEEVKDVINIALKRGKL